LVKKELKEKRDDFVALLDAEKATPEDLNEYKVFYKTLFSEAERHGRRQDEAFSPR
jgi:hypothetical protein